MSAGRPTPDGRALDGLVSDGERLVRKGGRVKFAGAWWQHDLLVPYVGRYVYLDNIDYWRVESCSASTVEPYRNICTLRYNAKLNPKHK